MVKSGKFTVQQPSIAGRLGSGIGQGLAESLPKEMDRGRLAAGLKQFEQEAPNLSPLQQATRLFSIPGITPQMVQVLPELIRQQRERQNAINSADQSQETYPENSGNQSLINSPSIQTSSAPSQPNRRENLFRAAENLATRNKGITTTGPVNAALSDIRPPTQQEVYNKRAEILRENPWMSVDAAEARAIDFFNRQNAQKTAEMEKGARQESIQNKVDQEFEKETNLLLQKDKSTGQFEDLSGASFADLRDQAREDVSNGILTPTQAAKKYSRLALQLAKNNTKLNEMSSIPLIMQKPKSIVNNLMEASKLWKEANRSEEFSNKVQEKFGVSQKMADSLAFPIQDNKKLNSYVEKYSPPRPRGLTGLPNTNDIYESSVKAASDIANIGLSDDDSINSIIVALKNKDPHFDDSAFITRLRGLYNSGKLQLNPRQREEVISQDTAWFPNLKDWWMKISSQF
jgi:hypothetical protein